jgi:hypothetical protein
LRHPVDQTIISYYDFINNSDEGLTLQEYLGSPYMQHNPLTRLLSNVSDLKKENVDITNLNLAKEVLRRKCLVGIYELLDQSIELFRKYFDWHGNRSSKEINTDECVTGFINDSIQETELTYKKLDDQKYNVEYDSDIYNAIVTNNQFDMELYWYAFDLHMGQISSIISQG